jgi:hypothetical protein
MTKVGARDFLMMEVGVLARRWWYHARMGDMTRRELIARSIGGGIALRVPLDAFAQTRDQIPAEIETKIPSAEAIDMIVRDFVREMKGSPSKAMRWLHV